MPFFFLGMAGGAHVIALRQPALFEPSAAMESEDFPSTISHGNFWATLW